MGVRISADLGRLQKRLRSLARPAFAPALREVGEALASSTIGRFNQQSDPQGKAWQPLALATIQPGARDYRKNGGIRKAALRRLERRKILIQSARLRNSISHRAEGLKVHVGTNVKYARLHQLGGEAGRGKKITIPARPFLGISDADQREIVSIINRTLGDF